MQERESIRKGFNRLSPFYDALAFIFFGRSLWRAQSHFISSLPRVNNVLIIGGGTGKILTHLISHNIAHRYYYLDISNEMVKRAGERTRKEFPSEYGRIVFHAGTVHDIPPNESFDIIITPFVLDVIPSGELFTDMQRMDSLLNREGSWVFTDFHYPEKGMKRSLSKMLVGSLYFFARVICSVKNNRLPDTAEAFNRMGYKITKEKYFLGEMLVSRVYSRM